MGLWARQERLGLSSRVGERELGSSRSTTARLTYSRMIGGPSRVAHALPQVPAIQQAVSSPINMTVAGGPKCQCRRPLLLKGLLFTDLQGCSWRGYARNTRRCYLLDADKQIDHPLTPLGSAQGTSEKWNGRER